MQFPLIFSELAKAHGAEAGKGLSRALLKSRTPTGTYNLSHVYGAAREALGPRAPAFLRFPPSRPSFLPSFVMGEG